jgi:hypothetical protein
MTVDLAALLSSSELALRAERKPPQTVKPYTAGVVQYLAFCEGHGLPAVLDRRQVAAFTSGPVGDGAEAEEVRAMSLTDSAGGHLVPFPRGAVGHVEASRWPRWGCVLTQNGGRCGRSDSESLDVTL